MRVITYVCTVYFSEDIHFPILKKAKGARQLQLPLFDAPKLSELGIIFFGIMITIVSIIPYVFEKCGIE